MRLTFVLPLFQTRVSGGYRVVYEYANHLSKRGHSLTLVMPNPSLDYRGAQRWLHHDAWRQRGRRIRAHRRIPWFPFDDKVAILAPTSARPKALPRADVTVATAWRTAPFVAAAPDHVGRRAYLIQHHEVWDGNRDSVNETWRLPLHKIVISRWLRDLARELDPAADVDYVPNGVDFDTFRATQPVNARPAHHVGMLCHPSTWKGTEDGIAALLDAKNREPQLTVTLFGYPPRPPTLPDWMGYLQKPAGQALVEYYNSLAVFLHPSLAEGWPLPPAEAMSSGVALVAADNPGVLDYAVPGKTALVVARGDRRGMTEAVLELVRDDVGRQALAQRGQEAIHEYTWARATDSFEQCMVRLTEATGP